jgi:hypothetical protein
MRVLAAAAASAAAGSMGLLRKQQLFILVTVFASCVRHGSCSK